MRLIKNLSVYIYLSKFSICLIYNSYIQLFTENMIGFLGQMGYPVDKFDVIVKLKDGQSTES